MSASIAHSSELPPERIEEIAALLKQLQPGFLPGPIFEAVTRLVATPVIEVVPLRRSTEGKVQVLLTQRGPEDRWWPNMLHTPGAVVLATDSAPDNTEALERVMDKELAGVESKPPVFAFGIKHNSERGAEQARVFWAEVSGDPKVGTFYDSDALPPDLVASQLDFIPLAVQNYETASATS